MLSVPKAEEESNETVDKQKTGREPSPGRTTRSRTKASEMDINALLKFIKPYDGSREHLNSFIIKCTNAMDLATDVQKPMLFKYIINSLEGKAATTCSIREFNDWTQLKDFLKTQFSEHKHYTHLLTELQDCKQGVNETVSQFSLRVETSLFNLLTEITLANYPQKEIPGRIASMEDLALHHFLMGLLPRISNIVRARSPKNLNSAVNLAMSEEKIQNSQFAKRNINQPLSGGRHNYNNSYRQNPKSPPNNFNTFRPSGSNVFNSNNPGTSKHTGQALFCRYCKASGHDIKDCEIRITNNNRRNQKFNNPQIHRVTHIDEDTHCDDPSDNYIDQPDDPLNE